MNTFKLVKLTTMASNWKLSDASPLKGIYQQDLLTDYSSTSSLFDNIKSWFNINNVKKINNPHLYGMYLLCKEELSNNDSNVNEKTLYHATSPKNAVNIAKNNINWRKTIRSRFGVGVCFSDSPIYANRYSNSKGAFIICKVLTKNIEEVNISYGLKIPNNNYDTTSGNNGKVYVKFDDYSFYPEYIVYYSEI